MRVALVAPSRSDPAHRRVLAALRKRLTALGDEVSVFPPTASPASRDPRRALERWLRARDAQICHVQYFSRGLGYLGRLRLPPGLKLVLTHQGASFDLMEHPEAFRRLARRADALTAVSSSGLAELRSRVPRAGGISLCIPNGTDCGPAPELPAARGRRPFILSVGRLSAYKGTDLLLMAFASVAAEDRGLDLVICGPDQSGGRLARFAAGLGLQRRVRFLGDTSPARIDSLLGRCLFFVLPSRKENMPMALLEAMAAGKAVLACAVGGVGEVVRDGVDGLLVAPQDAAALSRAMRRLIQDARLRRRLGRRARLSAGRFDWSVAAASYHRLYARLLAADRPGRRAQEY